MMVGGATFEALLSVNGNSHCTTALDIADCNDGRCDLPPMCLAFSAVCKRSAHVYLRDNRVHLGCGKVKPTSALGRCTVAKTEANPRCATRKAALL